MNVLTHRQTQVLLAIASGASDKQTARRLGITPPTVKRHAGRLILRLGASNRPHAVYIALSHRLIPPEPGTPRPGGPGR
jgi:DNA-binding CsgD family transcriptional regulator